MADQPNGNGRNGVASVIIAAIGSSAAIIIVLVSVGSLSISPISDGVKETRSEIKEIKHSTLDKADQLERFRQIEIGVQRLDAATRQLQDQIVPRGEHAEKWRSSDSTFVSLQRQIEEINKKFGDTYSMRDALNDLIKRIERQEQKNPQGQVLPH